MVVFCPVSCSLTSGWIIQRRPDNDTHEPDSTIADVVWQLWEQCSGEIDGLDCGTPQGIRGTDRLQHLCSLLDSARATVPDLLSKIKVTTDLEIVGAPQEQPFDHRLGISCTCFADSKPYRVTGRSSECLCWDEEVKPPCCAGFIPLRDANDFRSQWLDRKTAWDDDWSDYSDDWSDCSDDEDERLSLSDSSDDKDGDYTDDEDEKKRAALQDWRMKDGIWSRIWRWCRCSGENVSVTERRGSWQVARWMCF